MVDVLLTSTCRKTIEPTLNTFQEKVKCSEPWRFIVNVDVKNSDYLTEMIAYLHEMNIDDIRINHNPDGWPKAHADALNYLLPRIQSPVYFHLQDDWQFLRPINLDTIIELMNKHDTIDIIRFNKQKTREYAWLYHRSTEDTPEYRKNNLQRKIDNVNLVQTWVWSFNPSIVRTSTVKSVMPFPETTNSEKFLCKQYDEKFSTRGSYIWGEIGERASVKHLGYQRWVIYKRLKRKLENGLKRLKT